jgi:predicted PurR-regulated permease PerM
MPRVAFICSAKTLRQESLLVASCRLVLCLPGIVDVALTVRHCDSHCCGIKAIVARQLTVDTMNSQTIAPWARHAVLAALIGGLLVLVYLVLAPFLAAVAWAGILAYITWPIYSRLRSWTGGRRTLSALFAVICLGLTLALPLLWLIILIQRDLVDGYNTVAIHSMEGRSTLRELVSSVPWIGVSLQNWLDVHLADPAGLYQHLAQWITEGASQLLILLGGIGRNAAKLAIALITLFFFYRDGERLVQQVRDVLRTLLGSRVNAYLNATGEMSRAILQSVIFTAFLQGLIAALGYWIVGVRAPILLGVATAVASVIPVLGTVLVWGPLSIVLLLGGHPWQGFGLIAWGVLLIHPADNLIRPLLISNTTQPPVLLVMFGVLGGLAAFGLVGLFIGPVILAVAAAAWREWVQSVSGIPKSTEPKE